MIRYDTICVREDFVLLVANINAVLLKFKFRFKNLHSTTHLTDCLCSRHRCRSLYPLSEGAGSTGEHHGHLLLLTRSSNSNAITEQQRQEAYNITSVDGLTLPGNVLYTNGYTYTNTDI
jgi:hypothetical protein